jgi:hypothetical protein
VSDLKIYLYDVYDCSLFGIRVDQEYAYQKLEFEI